MDGNAQPVRVVIASDGKRGHLNQNNVIARMLGDSTPLVLNLRDPEGGTPERLLRARFLLFGPRAVSRAVAASLVPRMLRPESPEDFRDFTQQVAASGRGQRGASNQSGLRIFCVSTGTPGATMNLLLGRLLGAEGIVNMVPSMLPLSCFALCILPLHDTIRRPAPANGVVSPLAIGVYDAVQAAFIAKEICERSGLSRAGRYFGLAVGGPSRSAPWDPPAVKSALTDVLRACRAEGCRVLATTSRRTPQWCADWLATEGAALADMPFLLDAAKDELNPLPGIYDLCAGLAVTADSFSMVSEAVHAGMTPLLLRGSAQRMRPKLEHGLQGIVDNGRALWHLPGEGVRPVLDKARCAANLEYERLRLEVRARLGLAV